MAHPYHDAPSDGDGDDHEASSHSPWHLEHGQQQHHNDDDDDNGGDEGDDGDDLPNADDDNAIPEPSVADSSDMRIRSVSPVPEASSSSLVLPLWLRESQRSSSFFRGRWRRWVPLGVRATASFVRDWTKGPKIPQIQRIRPWLPVVQEAPLWLVRRCLPRRWHKVLALLVLYAAWFVTFVAVLRNEAASGYVEGYGVPASLWCGASLWSPENDCGLDGNNCRPFNNASLAFRCNANCANMQISTPHPVGDRVLNYEPLVVGGPEEEEEEREEEEREEREERIREKREEKEERIQERRMRRSGQEEERGQERGQHKKMRRKRNGRAVYRADSFICQAAVHAGVVSNDRGGCGVLHLAGHQSSFAASQRNGIQSHGFSSSFPKSYTFDTTVATECGVVDLRWPLLAVTVVFTSVVSLFVASPAVFFASIFTMLFFHVGLVSDKPNIADYTALFSLMLGRFLPAAFTATVIYRFSVRPQLTGLTAQVEKTVLWLGGAWVGALSNYTLDFIPIQRLTPHDIRAQPGALLSLVLICLLLFAIACGQVYYLRLEGRLRRYLLVYGLMAAALLVGVALPNLHLRIHHYILALLLLPGTRPQTRPGLLYQGLLVGLFVNGTARWGFDSLLQTAAALYSGGGESTGSVLPNITAVVAGLADGGGGGGNVSVTATATATATGIATTTAVIAASASGAAKSGPGPKRSIAFSWPPLPPAGYDGLSILVNDVERHRWYVGEGASAWSWQEEERRNDREALYYFRFAFMAGSQAADYTKAGIWEVGTSGNGGNGNGGNGNGSGRWREMEPGAVGDLALFSGGVGGFGGGGWRGGKGRTVRMEEDVGE